MFFSVVIPLYNKERQIAGTLRSVFAQTCADYEIIVVDDGSTDGSAAVVESLHDPRIRLIRQANAGVSAARNLGIAEARGEYVALLDADDEWRPEYLATIADLIRRYPQCDVFATNYSHVDSNGKTFPTILRKLPFDDDDGILYNYFEVASVSSPPLWTSAVAVRKSAFQSVGGFPLGIKSGEDLLTWARLAARYKIAYSKKPLAVFNVEGYDRNERPKRIPAENDIVATELLKLKDEFNPSNINQYISFWHKMRAVIYMRLGMKSKSIKEAFKAARYNPLNWKALAVIPFNFIRRWSE